MAYTMQELKRAYLAQALLEVVQECPTGAPAGVMYAACCGHLDYDAFEKIMSTLVRMGRIERKSHCYFPITASVVDLVAECSQTIMSANQGE